MQELEVKPAVTIEVSKRAGENLIDTVNKVKKVVNKEQRNFPKSIQASLLVKINLI